MALNVLIVDDSVVMRRMVERVLRLSGVPLGDVREAGDGAAGLAALAARPADLVLLDVNMPVMDGEEMLRRLRAVPATAALPVVVVSTGGGEARRRALEAFDVAFVRKPFRPEALRAAIVRAAGLDPDDTPHAAHAPAGTAPGDDGALDF